MNEDDGLLAALILIIIVGLFSGAILGALYQDAHWKAVVPQCLEDQVLVGYREFEAGRWSIYECGPALDDFGGTP